MYNYPLYYLHVASYKTPSNNHPTETRLYLNQAKNLLQDKLAKFQLNNNKVEQLQENSYLVQHPNSNDPIVVSVLFDLDKFKSKYSNYFYRFNRDKDKNKSMEIFSDILLTDNVVIDLSVLVNKGKRCNTKLLTTNSTNLLTIEEELDELNTNNLQLGDFLYNCVTTNYITTNTNDIKIVELVDNYYQPKQLISLCDDYCLEPNILLSTKNTRYLITTENDTNLLTAYSSIIKCKKVNCINLQYAHIEYCNLFV